MLDAILWGLVQGLTEFLPISSSGHLVLVPALLGRPGPDLATSAMLHLGTLAAVVAYFRRDLLRIVRLDPTGRRTGALVLLGTVPAAVAGLTLEASLEVLNDRPRIVAAMLVVTGIVLVASTRLRRGDRDVDELGASDALVVGAAQALALVPGVSRSGATIVAGLVRGLSRVEAARWAFLLGIPAIAGAGLFEGLELLRGGGGISAATLVGVVVAGVSGYAAIALLLRVLATRGLLPFGLYCLAAGSLALVVL